MTKLPIKGDWCGCSTPLLFIQKALKADKAISVVATLLGRVCRYIAQHCCCGCCLLWSISFRRSMHTKIFDGWQALFHSNYFGRNKVLFASQSTITCLTLTLFYVVSFLRASCSRLLYAHTKAYMAYELLWKTVYMIIHCVCVYALYPYLHLSHRFTTLLSVTWHLS